MIDSRGTAVPRSPTSLSAPALSRTRSPTDPAFRSTGGVAGLEAAAAPPPSARAFDGVVVLLGVLAAAASSAVPIPRLEPDFWPVQLERRSGLLFRAGVF